MSIPTPEKRILEFERLGFGMFIHYGLYSQLARGEWVMNASHIGAEEYSKLMETFTAKQFDGRTIARIAKSTGMKYITLTARHHDGFSLYDTRGLCNYDAPHSAAGRDLIQDFVEGCNAEGILPILYHTTLDWFQPIYQNNFKEYLEYLRKSIEILCTKYGKVGGFWFDGNWSRPASDWDEDGLYSTIRKYQPEALIINNTGMDARGRIGHPEIDCVTYEQGKPMPMQREKMAKYVAAEMCQTLNEHWGFAESDMNYKSISEIIETLCVCRKVGANYLLNVGLGGEGDVVSIQRNFLDELGKWIKLCGNSIYQGKPSEICAENKDFALEADNIAFFYIHDLHTVGSSDVVTNGSDYGYRHFRNVKKRIKRIVWTDNNESLDFVQHGENVWFDANGYPYGCNYVVRVARIEFENQK